MHYDEFATTRDGATFFDRYDTLAQRSSAVVSELGSRWGTTRVNAYGPENAPPVVLLPGSGATSLSYVDVVGPLAESHRVYAVDLIGDAGRSRVGEHGPRTTDDLLDWLLGVIDALGAPEVDLVGHSYGAMIALAFTLGPHADRIRHLALLDPTSCFAGLRPSYLLHALPVLVSPNPRRQRRFLEWETRSARLNSLWVDMYCAGARFPTTKTIVPKRPKPADLSTLDASGISVSVILAPHSRAHDSAAVADTIGRLMPRARVHLLGSGSHHTFPLAPADEISAALLDGLGVAR